MRWDEVSVLYHIALPADWATHLAAQVARCDRTGDRVALLFVDLDGFKPVNDTFGHSSGDLVLKQVGERLKSVLRSGDMVGRIGGDEFVLLLPYTNAENAEAIATRVREAIDALPAVDGRVKISTSVGVASYPHDGHDGRTLLHVADQRMYEDKFRRRSDHRLQTVR